MSASFRRALWCTVCFLACALRGQTPATPPALAGISGGGSVELGQTINLTAQFTGSSVGMTYQWRKAGVEIAGATTNPYNIPAATPGDSGTYHVTVRNAAGESVASTELTVRSAAPPIVTVGPRHAIAQVGQSANFTVTATGSYPRTYQWRKDGTPVAGGTNVILSVPNLTTADAGTYSVVISNSFGSATSGAASLTVNAATPPLITPFSPGDTSFVEGSNASLFVSLAGGSSPFTVQWFKDGVAVPGATSGQLSFPEITAGDAGKYSARISNVAGSATSREAVVTVTPATPPSVTFGPQSLTVYEGDSAYFGVSHAGSSPVRFQWTKDGAAIAGATQSSYQLSNVAVAHGGDYRVTVSNYAGAVTSAPAKLTVHPASAPKITTEPRDAVVTEEGRLSLSVAAEGTPPLSFQWYLNGTKIPTAVEREFSSFPKVLDTGTYHVVVTNPVGSTKSRDVAVTVHRASLPAVPIVYVEPAVLGETFSISAGVSSSSSLAVQWYRNGELLPGATTTRHTFAAAKAEDAGEYFAVLTNSGGSTVSRTAHVSVASSKSKPAGAWIAAERSADMVYFAFANPARIERFNLATETWLTPVSLPRAPSTFVVANGAFYTSSGSVIYRYNLDGTGETILNSAFNSAILGMTSWQGFLLAQDTQSSVAKLTSVRMSDGALISSQAYIYRWGPTMAAAANSGRIYSRTTGVSPSDITMTTIQPDGSLAVSVKDSPYHGSFPDADRLFLAPTEEYVIENSGTIYRGADLSFAGSLTGAVDDIAFIAGNQVLALQAGVLVRFDERFLEVGRLATGTNAARVFVRNGDVFLFSYPESGFGIAQAKRSLSAIASNQPAAPLDAMTVGFTPDAVFVDTSEVLHLYSKLHRQIFRWSPTSRSYLAPIPLEGWPDHVTYSPATHRIYLGYADKRILQVKLDRGSLREEAFATAPQRILAMTTAGEFLVINDPTSPWVSLFTFGSDGRLISQRAWSEEGAAYAWHGELRRLYQLRGPGTGGALSYYEIKFDGTLGEQRGTAASGVMGVPSIIRISPDQNSLLLGSGKFYNASTVTLTNSLPHAIDDAAWLSSRLVTAQALPAGARIESWAGNNYALDQTRDIPGQFVRMFALSPMRLLVVTAKDGIPYFTLLDEGLGQLTVNAGGLPTRLANLAARAQVGRNDQILIPGFVITGTQSKRVLIRAAGPALTAFHVSGVLSDPQISIHDERGNTIAANDDWGSAINAAELAGVTARVGAFAFGPGSRDAAALLTLQPGGYTVQTRGAADATGVALVEVYDAQDHGALGRLVNIAARAQVGTGADVLIPGIVIQGNSPKTVLIRAVGPGLAAFGVTGVLTNPRLRLYRGEQVLQENDNWDQVERAMITQVIGATTQAGAFPLATGSKDAAILMTLPPGSYTAHVSGTDNTAGVALVEVYELNQ